MPDSSPTPIRRRMCTTTTYLTQPTIIRNTAIAGLIDPSPAVIFLFALSTGHA